MCGQGYLSPRPENQFVNTRVFTWHRRRFQVWTITGGWLIGIVALFCVPAGAQAPAAGISASATTVEYGRPVTLTWNTVNAVSANLNGTAVPLVGSLVVYPTTTTAYSITADGLTGATAVGTVVVTVVAAGISASATTVEYGRPVTLTWNTVGAASADLNGTAVPLTGSLVVYPTATTAYRITAHGSAGVTDEGTVVVTVVAAVISASSTTAAPGQAVTLTWNTVGAVSADLNGTAVPLTGSLVVYPTATTAYRITAHGSAGVTDARTVVVTMSSGNSDPSISGQWTPVQTWPYMGAHAHLLPDGEVLFWPSFELGDNPTLWNPVTNTFSAVPPAAYNIFCSGHSFLPDGTLLVTGGHDGSSGYGYPYASIYDPVKNVWTQISNMSNARWYPTNTTLANGDLLVTSGEITPGVYNTLPEIWHSATSSWIDLTSAQFQQPLYPMMFVAPNGQVFNAGPNRYTWSLNTSGTGAWTEVGSFNYNGTRDYGSAVMFDGKVLIAGGDGSGSNAATSTAEIIDLNATSPSWQFTSSMANPRRQHNLTLLPDGKVLVTGGSIGYGFDNAIYPVYPTEMWDPVTGKWTAMANITVYRGYHSTALLLPDGRVVSAGGEQTGASAEIYSPPYLFKGARPSITSAPSSVKYGQAFFVATPHPAAISQVTWIRLGSVSHSINMNQRLNHLRFAQARGGLNITAPASGNLAPPGHYMLFLVNGNGVPSVASIIQITN